MLTNESDSKNDAAPVRKPYPEFETLMSRALRLRCPRCGEGKLFKHWFRMNSVCPVCKFLIDRPDGYYLGSMYVNYGATAWITTIGFLICRLALKIPGQALIWPLAAFCVIFPTLFFRHARAFWLALDCQFDRSVLDEDREETPDEER